MYVMPLVKTLYGHPQAGVFWEQRCERAVFKAGFARVGECGEWRSCYFNKAEGLFLMVYVDDFKLSGPVEAVKKMWKHSTRWTKTRRSSSLPQRS